MGDMIGPDLDIATETLQALGARHARYGVIPSVYPKFGEALVHGIEQVLGPKQFTNCVKSSWIRIYCFISKTMIQGARRQEQEQRRRRIQQTSSSSRSAQQTTRTDDFSETTPRQCSQNQQGKTEECNNVNTQNKTNNSIRFIRDLPQNLWARGMRRKMSK